MTRVTINAIETIILDVPTIRPHVLSVATMQSQTIVIVRLLCSDGIVGFGEGTTIGGLSYGAESPESIKLTIDRYVAPVLIGSDARPASAMAMLRRHIVANHFAKNAIETALLDAQGRPCASARAAGPVDRCEKRVSARWLTSMLREGWIPASKTGWTASVGRSRTTRSGSCTGFRSAMSRPVSPRRTTGASP